MSIQPFQFRIQVKDQDIDELGHVNNVVYVRYIQEVAEAHWKTFASINMQTSYRWVVLRHEIDYKHPAFAGDCLVGETWVEEPEGIKVIRHVRLLNDLNGKLITQSRTTWCLLDALSLKSKRIDQKVAQVFDHKSH